MTLEEIVRQTKIIDNCNCDKCIYFKDEYSSRKEYKSNFGDCVKVPNSITKHRNDICSEFIEKK